MCTAKRSDTSAHFLKVTTTRPQNILITKSNLSIVQPFTTTMIAAPDKHEIVHASRSPSPATRSSLDAMPAITALGPYDVLCGRCKEAFNNVGNRRLRITISLNLKRYMEAPSRWLKSEVVLSMLQILQEEIGVRFLKHSPTTKGHYIEISDKDVRTKIAHAFRDQMAAYQSGLRKKAAAIEKKKRKQKRNRQSRVYAPNIDGGGSQESSVSSKKEEGEDDNSLDASSLEVLMEACRAQICTSPSSIASESSSDNEEGDPMEPLPLSFGAVLNNLDY